MGEHYNNSTPSNCTELLIQRQAFAACGDREVRDAVRNHIAEMWSATAAHTGIPPMAVKSLLAYGTLLNVTAALDIDIDTDTVWAQHPSPNPLPHQLGLLDRSGTACVLTLLTIVLAAATNASAKIPK